MEKETVIRPSLLACDFLHLQEELEECMEHGFTHIHFDVMDGNFVEEISFGEPLFRKVQEKFGDDITFDVHLMVVNPIDQIRLFAALGAREISLHFEAMCVGDVIELTKIEQEYPSLKIGLAISPETKVEEMREFATAFDFVLVMSVHPGKGGQKFMPEALEKIKQLAALREEKGAQFEIGVDGGINEENGSLCVKAGANFLVAGTSYFKAKDRYESVKRIKGL
jgi:ribulose-phosphate 3-epimerase